MAGKQAKTLNDRQIKAALAYLNTTRHPDRNRLIFLLSCKAGLRAKEIASLTWSMLTDSEGELTGQIVLPDSASKGKSGRTIPIGKLLLTAVCKMTIPDNLDKRVLISERGNAMSAQVIKCWFGRIYKEMNFNGCSSHSGRRTFGTNSARKAVEAGCSMREVQKLMGHKTMAMTQLYIDENEEGKKRLMDII